MCLSCRGNYTTTGGLIPTMKSGLHLMGWVFVPLVARGLYYNRYKAQ